MPAKHIVVYGKVQGVFFRVSAKKQAERIAITGWVKNTKEGNVEIMAQGSEEQVAEFLAWCKQGPPKARVDKVLMNDIPEEPGTEFKILHN